MNNEKYIPKVGDEVLFYKNPEYSHKIGFEAVVSWISVEDKLPEMTRSKIWSDDDCIVATEYNFEIGRTKNGEWVNMINQSITGVTHWMPIPEPPQSN